MTRHSINKGEAAGSSVIEPPYDTKCDKCDCDNDGNPGYGNLDHDDGGTIPLSGLSHPDPCDGETTAAEGFSSSSSTGRNQVGYGPNVHEPGSLAQGLAGCPAPSRSPLVAGPNDHDNDNDNDNDSNDFGHCSTFPSVSMHSDGRRQQPPAETSSEDGRPEEGSGWQGEQGEEYRQGESAYSRFASCQHSCILQHGSLRGECGCMNVGSGRLGGTRNSGGGEACLQDKPKSSTRHGEVAPHANDGTELVAHNSSVVCSCPGNRRATAVAQAEPGTVRPREAESTGRSHSPLPWSAPASAPPVRENGGDCHTATSRWIESGATNPTTQQQAEPLARESRASCAPPVMLQHPRGSDGTERGGGGGSPCVLPALSWKRQAGAPLQRHLEEEAGNSLPLTAPRHRGSRSTAADLPRRLCF